ncbi:hypothetical protein CP061683_1413B, partial [Chlamydia psittaci 06-1683]
ILMCRLVFKQNSTKK